jgi:hypothetical protein
MTCRNASALQPLLLIGAAAFVACSAESPKAQLQASFDPAASRAASPAIATPVDTSATQPSAPGWWDMQTPSVDSLAPAYRHFASFLEVAVATDTSHGAMLDSLYSRGSFDELGIAERDDDVRWLAASRILSVRTEGDSGNAVAVITTVARQTPESEEGHYAVRFGIQDDTARWLLIRDVDDGHWKVDADGVIINNGARDQFTVLALGRDIHWVMGSRQQALAAIDSIRVTRGLEVVR